MMLNLTSAASGIEENSSRAATDSFNVREEKIF